MTDQGHDEADHGRRAGSRHWRWMLEYGLVQLLVAVVRVLTPRQCAALCRLLAWLIGDVFGVRRRVADDNLARVHPELTAAGRKQVLRQMWYHLLMMGCEIVLAPRKIHRTNWRKHIHIIDKREMTARLIDYRPLVAVSGHFGNFEMAGYVIGLLGMPSYTVARKLDNPWLDRFVNQFRERNGQFLLPKDGSAHRVDELLREGRILTLLGDQHAGSKGCWVDFLGRPASCHKAVALFTMGGRAPMMVSYCRQLGQPLQFEVGCTGIADPLDLPAELGDVRALTQWYSDRLGDAVRRSPAQYWWLHRRWRDRPVRGHSRKAA